jgi:hypothetical protein
MVARPGGAMAVTRYHFWLVARYHRVDWATGGVADGGVVDGGVAVGGVEPGGVVGGAVAGALGGVSG